ncbi:nucleolar protein 11 isoform X2 [Pseudophryne corroboree]|uniref:nucleolar protein 11 isoform X2 n=1 Tax=Pseudophryne corroboree TaxID=495146 RepID=UPI0030821450
MVHSAMESHDNEEDNMDTIYRAAHLIRKSTANFTKAADDANTIQVASDIHDVPVELYTMIHWIMIGPAESLQSQRRTTAVERTALTVSDQRPLGSWTVKQGQRITCPAVSNHRTGEYVVVHDEKVLRIWKNDDVNFDKVFKATLSAAVCRVHSLPDTEPLVLFRGGAVHFLDALLADPQQEIESFLTEGETIVWSKMFLEDGQPILIYITEKHQDCFVHTWRTGPGVSQTYRLQPFTEDSRVLDFAASLTNKMVSLIMLLSTGHVCLSWVSLGHSEQRTESVLSTSSLLQLPEPIESGALVVLDESYIATLTLSPAKQKDCLCIWNTSLQTLQDSKEFVQKSFAQLWSYDNKLYIPHGNSLLVIRYICEPSCLASALGKGIVFGKPDLDPVPVVNWGLLIGKTTQPRHLASKKLSRVKKKQDHNENRRQLQDLLSDIPTTSESQIPSLVQCAISDQELPEFQIIAAKMMQGLINRCKSDTKFYPQSSIIKLIETKQLSYSLCPDLMMFCLEKQDVRVLQLCLQQFIDIPEAVVCSCLKTFLSVDEDTLQDVVLDTVSSAWYILVSDNSNVPMEPEQSTVVQNGFSPTLVEENSCDIQILDKIIQRQETQSFPVSLKRAVILNSVITSLYSETYLLPHLKDLSSDQVILFLSYLFYLYKKCSENVALNLPGEEHLSVTQILDWMNLLLDANFTVLVMLPKAKPLLRTLQKFVRTQMKFYSELNKIEGSLSELQRLQRPSKSIGRYSIEVLELY